MPKIILPDGIGTIKFETDLSEVYVEVNHHLMQGNAWLNLAIDVFIKDKEKNELLTKKVYSLYKELFAIKEELFDDGYNPEPINLNPEE